MPPVLFSLVTMMILSHQAPVTDPPPRDPVQTGIGVPSDIRLQVMPGDGVTNPTSAARVSRDAGVFHFGPVSLLDTPLVEKTFLLKNVSSAPLTIDKLVSSCGCLSTLEDDVSRPSEGVFIVKPGETRSLKVSIPLKEVTPGALNKSVRVFAREHPERAVAVLTLEGVILPTVTFSPPSVTFGTISAAKVLSGIGKSIEVTATPDKRLLSKGKAMPPLVAKQPGILITPLGPADDTAATFRYRLSIAPDVPLGNLNVTLGYAPTDAGTDQEGARQTMAWQNVLLPVTAYVLGDISVTPELIAFGQVRRGDTAQRVTLTATTPIALAGLTVTADTPDLIVKRLAGDSKKPLDAILEVQIAETAPTGAFRSRLLVTLANKQRLVVPVSAYIAPASPP